MGFTWIATQDGINMFDGNRFTKYTQEGERPKKISGGDIRWITVDTLNHLLWVLNPELVINAINYQTGEVIKTISGKRTNNDDWSVSMTLCNNRLWICCMNGIKIYNVASETWEKAPSVPFKKNKNDDLFSVRTIYADEKGNIWAFVNHYGIVVIDSKSRLIIKTINNRELVPANQTAGLNFTSVINLTPNKLLIGTTLGLKIITYNANLKINTKGKSEALPYSFSRGKIDAITKTPNLIYIAGSSNLYKLNYDLSACIKIKESNTSDKETWLSEINNLYADYMGNLWIGCKQGLAFLSSTPSAFKSFTGQNYSQSGLTHAYNLFPASKGTMLIGQEKSLLKYDSTNNKFSSINNLKSFNFSFTDFKKRTIVSADDGLFVLTPKGLISVAAYYPELKPISDCYINSCVNIGDSISVIGSDNDRGVFFWNYKRRKLRIINNTSLPVRLRSNIVKKVFRDSKGRIWVLSGFGIDIIEKDLSKINCVDVRDPVNGNPLRLYFDICEVNGRFWLANYSYGIVETDFNGHALKILNTKDGLCNNGVYKIFNPDKKNLIITSNNGLSVYNLKNSTFTSYYKQDGLHSSAFEENCGTEKNGKIYAGGLNGFTIIDPKLLFVNKAAPKLYFTDIKINTQSGSKALKDLNIKNLIVPDDALQTSISFVGLNYTNPTRVRYKYKIEELNSNWIDLGTQNFIDIIGISPGNYHLLVESANENGIWNKVPIKLSMLFLPKWYQTWWFKITVLVSICGILYAVYQYRIKQIKVQQQIRRDIASDLHDDLGSTLNSIKIFTHLAIEKKQNSSYLYQIEKLITSTAVGLRDMLWVLEDSRDNVEELMERIQNFAAPIAHANQINFEHHVEPGLGSKILSKTEKRNLLLIAKEAINNCFKYAQCQTIKVIIKTGNNNKISLSISDDGVGFNINDKSKGYGLNNIKHRAEQINYLLRCNSSHGNGTAITVEKK